MRAVTTLRLETLLFHEDLFPDETGLRDGSGWKCHCAKNYVQSISLADVETFIALSAKKLELKDVDENRIRLAAQTVYNTYQFLLNETTLVVLKSKTEMDRSEDVPREKEGFLAKLFKFGKNSRK